MERAGWYDDHATQLAVTLAKHRSSPLHSQTLPLATLSNGGTVVCKHPGLKTTPTKYDFRVDLSRGSSEHTLSHVDIIVDIFWKVRYRRNELEGLDLLTWLQRLFAFGPSADLWSSNYHGNVIDPIVHQSVNSKMKNRKELREELSFEELAVSASWIALQEDINYPYPKRGRALPCLVYAEAIHAASQSANHFALLNRTIERAERHGPPLQLLSGVKYPPFVLARFTGRRT